MLTLSIRSNFPSFSGPISTWSPGHSWIEIRHDNGTVESYGYYPQTGGLGNIDGPGTVEWGSDALRVPDRISQDFAITADQLARIRDFVSKSESGSYSLDGIGLQDPIGTWNCATWVRDAIRESGISVEIPIIVIAPWWLPGRVADPLTSLWDAEGWNDNGIDQRLDSLWRSAITPPRRDPLAIDLDSDGIETVGLPTNGSNPVLFDHDANGVKTGTGWLKGDDAWLVRDLNGNGSIESGRELFGVDTLITVTETAYGRYGPYQQTITRNARNGFEALSTLDDNRDGVFNASDAAFGQLKLWQDLNQDGLSQAGEQQSLAAAGITSIALTPTTTTTDLGNGNTITGTAAVQRGNGSTTHIDSVDLSAGNLNLADNPFYREFTDSIPLSTAARGLPDMGGSGWVRDLRDAMSRRRGHPGAGADGDRAKGRAGHRRGGGGQQGHRFRRRRAGCGHQVGDLPVHPLRHRAGDGEKRGCRCGERREEGGHLPGGAEPEPGQHRCGRQAHQPEPRHERHGGDQDRQAAGDRLSA
jgi:hypothetical protein